MGVVVKNVFRVVLGLILLGLSLKQSCACILLEALLLVCSGYMVWTRVVVHGYQDAVDVAPIVELALLVLLELQVSDLSWHDLIDSLAGKHVIRRAVLCYTVPVLETARLEQLWTRVLEGAVHHDYRIAATLLAGHQSGFQSGGAFAEL